MLFFKFDLFKPGYIFIVIGTLLIASSQLWAAPTSKKQNPTKVEMYDATEPGADVGTPAPLDETAPLEAPKKQKIIAKAEPEQKQISHGYDVVPDNRKELLLDRIELVEKLIRKHGRAYDYKTITNKDLTAILKRLDDEKASKQEESKELELDKDIETTEI